MADLLTIFQPTQEQKEILASFQKGKHIKVHAFAGTGKTSTLILLAESTSKSGLYVAFNKRVADEAKKKFPKNVTSSTIHSIAWKWAKEQFVTEKMIQSPNRTLLAKLNFIPKIRNFSEYKTITTISLTLSNFCNSREKTVTKSHMPWSHASYANEQEVLRRYSKSIVSVTQKIWEKMCDPESDLPLGHSGYLKLWSLRKPTLDYEFILVDEAQDLSPVMLEILDNYEGQKVLVGDSHQQIYSWRGAIDAMQYELDAENHFLTQTFRFSEKLSTLANRVLRSLSAHKPMESYSDSGTKIETTESDPINAYIFRKNASLIQKAVDLFESEKPFFIVDPNKNITQSVDDYFRLNDGLWGKSQAFEGFNSWDTVVSISKQEEVNPFRGFVELFENNDPELIRDAIKNSQKKESQSYPTLTTGHQAKGLEWNRVSLSRDFSFSSDDVKQGQIEEELRLLYVSMTRAKEILKLPQELYDFCENYLGQSFQKFAVIDLETTGLDPAHGDRITEIGIAIWQNGEIIDRYQSLINPGRKIPAFVQDLTGITDSMVKNERPSHIVLPEAMSVIGDMPLIAHNASFERKFLNSELSEISNSYSIDLICSLLLSRRIFPNLSGYKLGDLVSKFKLPKGKAHRALSDAEMTAHLLSKINQSLVTELEDDFILSADNLLRITKSTPKSFREHGVSKAYAQALKKFTKIRYSSFDFTKERFAAPKLKIRSVESSQQTYEESVVKTSKLKPSYTTFVPEPIKGENFPNALDVSPKKRPWIKWLIFLVIFYFLVRSCSSILSTPAQVSAPQKSSSTLDIQRSVGVVTASELRHRSCPSTDCGVVGGSVEGTRLVILEEKDGWYRITSEEKSTKSEPQWVSARYVEVSQHKKR